MWAIQFKQEPGSDKGKPHNSGRPVGKSAGATVIELGRALAAAESTLAIPALCSHCGSRRNPQSSTAEYAEVFCSEQCEQEFIRRALASLTWQDCIRIQGRLEDLLANHQSKAI